MANIPSSNLFDKQLTKNSQAANLNSTLAVSDLARNGSANTNVLQKDGKILQSERLFSARARYGATRLQESAGTNLEGSRGEWAYIKLLTSSQQYKEYVSGSTSRDVAFPKDLLGSGGPVAQLADAQGDSKTGYDRFLLTGVACNMSEKVQITEVFGDNEVVYYFGRQPLIFSLNGILIDSADNNWFVTWLQLYSDFLRGSQTAKNYELIKIVLPNMILTGTISGFSWGQDSQRDVDIPFSFQFIAKIVEPVPTTNEGMLTSNRLASVDFSEAYSFVKQSNINSLKGQMAKLTSTIQDPAASLKGKAAALSQLGSGIGGTFGGMLNSGKNKLEGFQSTIEGWNTSTQSSFNKIKNSAMFQTVTSSLEGIRTNLFSPIYGILSSLTKLVSNTLNTANKLVDAVIDPVRNILRDITNISNKAVALINLANNSIKAFGRNITGQLRGVSYDYKNALQALKKASGAIGSAPSTVSHSIGTMFSGGYLKSTTPFLKSSPKLTFTRPALLTVGATPVSKIALLKGITQYTAVSANSL